VNEARFVSQLRDL